jgi:hypothetical protein
MTLAVSIASPFAARPDETIGVLAVAPPPGPGPELVELTVQFQRVLAERTSGVLDAGHLRARMGGQGSSSSLTETDRAYEAARQADLARDPQRAIGLLQAIVQELETMADGEERFRQWKRAMQRLAKIESDLDGHEEQARAAVERLLRAAPDTQVEPGTNLAEQVDAMKRQLGKLPRRRVTVSSPSPGVRVYLEGRAIGTTKAAPVLATVPRGKYRVSGMRGELRAPPVEVDLGERDQTVTLDFTVPEILRPGSGPGLAVGPLDRAQVIAAGGYLRLDTVVTTHLLQEEGGVSYFVASTYDIRGGKYRVAGIIRLYNQAPPVGGLAGLADFLLGGKPRHGVVAEFDPLNPRLEALDIAQEAPGRRAKSKTLGWVAFSTAVATVGLTGVSIWQAVNASSNYSKAKSQILPDGSLPPDRTAFDKFNAAGDSASRNAIIAGVGAGACAVTTGILGYLSYKQTGEIGPFRF